MHLIYYEFFFSFHCAGITRHVKRRTESTHIWLGKSNHTHNILYRQDETLSFNFKAPTEESFEFQAEEKKQDDDTLDGETGSAYPQDNRSLRFDGSTGQPPYAIHHHITESSGSEIMRDENRTGDCKNDGAFSEDNAEPFGLKAVQSNHIVLSLNDEYYKQIMWRHYRILGKTRDSDRELRIGNEIFAIFQQKMGRTGRFFKRAQDQDFEVNDEIALLSKFDLVTSFPKSHNDVI